MFSLYTEHGESLKSRIKKHFLISNFRRVLNVVLYAFFWVIPRRLIFICRGITQQKAYNTKHLLPRIPARLAEQLNP